MFGFPEIKRPKGFKYKKNFLSSAIFQVKFPPCEMVTKDIEANKKKYLSDFDHANDLLRADISIPIGLTVENTSKQSARLIGIEFRKEANERVLNLAEDEITLTLTGAAYESFEVAKSQINSGFITPLKDFGVASLDRVAIRKVNVMETNINPTEKYIDIASRVFNPSLLADVTSMPAGHALITKINTLVFSNDDYKLHLRYGLFPKPGNGEHLSCLLDIDLFFEGKTESKQLVDRLEEINTEIFNVFDWALSAEAKAALDA